MTDADIIKRIRAGESEAYGELVERYQNAVYGQAYHQLRNFEDARDVAQEAFVQAYLRLGQLREPEKFGSWLRQVTINQCYMWQRRQRLTEPLDESAATAHEVERVDNRLMINEALACLSEASRLTLTLFYMHSYSLQEIATFLEVPVTTIKSRLRNARAQLRRELIEMVEDTLKQEPLPDDFAAQITESIRDANGGDFSKLKDLITRAQDNVPLMSALRTAMENDLKNGWQRFTQRSRNVCQLAIGEATRVRSPAVEPEHILAGLLLDGRGIGSRVLQQYDISLEYVRGEIAKRTATGGDEVLDLKMSTSAERLLSQAAHEAQELSLLQDISNAIGTEHILLAMLHDSDSWIAGALTQAGLDHAKALNSIYAFRGQV